MTFITFNDIKEKCNFFLFSFFNSPEDIERFRLEMLRRQQTQANTNAEQSGQQKDSELSKSSSVTNNDKVNSANITNGDIGHALLGKEVLVKEG